MSVGKETMAIVGVAEIAIKQVAHRQIADAINVRYEMAETPLERYRGIFENRDIAPEPIDELDGYSLNPDVIELIAMVQEEVSSVIEPLMASDETLESTYEPFLLFANHAAWIEKALRVEAEKIAEEVGNFSGTASLDVKMGQSVYDLPPHVGAITGIYMFTPPKSCKCACSCSKPTVAKAASPCASCCNCREDKRKLRVSYDNGRIKASGMERSGNVAEYASDHGHLYLDKKPLQNDTWTIHFKANSILSSDIKGWKSTSLLSTVSESVRDVLVMRVVARHLRRAPHKALMQYRAEILEEAAVTIARSVQKPKSYLVRSNLVM